MQIRSILFGIALALSFVVAQAQHKESGTHNRRLASTAWQHEPESILGIKIGRPLSDSMPPCPVDEYGFPRSTFKELCWVKSRYLGSHISIENHPKPGIHIWEVQVQTVADSVEHVSFYFNHYDQLSMAELLKARYGPPMEEETDSVQNRMGATFERKLMVWSGANLSLTFESRADRIDRGVVTLWSKRWSEAKKFDADKHKGKL